MVVVKKKKEETYKKLVQ